MGMGLNGVSDWSTQLPFIDLMKQSRSWKDWINHTSLEYDLDENDWPRSLKSGQTAGTVFLTLDQNSWDALPFQRVHVFYEGQGTLRYTVAAKLDSAASTPGHDVVDISFGNSFISITETNTNDPIREIRIIPDIFLANYENGEKFNPDWIERISQFRALRFMDWMQTNNSTETHWKDRKTPSSRTWKPVPLEVMIELANITQSEPWFNIPHLADTDYVENFAALVKEKLNPELNFYIEHSNEVWNWQFQQAQYANTSGRARWGDIGNAYMQWHGMRTAEICDTFKLGVFATEKNRVKCVLGVQTSYHGLQKGAIDCPLWENEGHEACYKHGFDYIAITSYFAGALNGPGKLNSESDLAWEKLLKDMIAEGDAGVQKAVDHLKTGDHFRELSKYADYQGVIPAFKSQLEYWMSYAESYGLKIVAYEGGQHITANGKALQNDTDLVNFHIAVNKHPEMYDIYTELFNAWKDSGAQLHMHFVDVSSPGKYGSWGALTNYKQTTTPRWQAIEDFNTQTACWWEDCR